MPELGTGPKRILGTIAILAALAICAAPGGAAADNDLGSNVSAAFRRCLAGAAANVDQSYCLDGELQRQKVNLNMAYNERLRGADPAFRARLERAQRAWVALPRRGL